MSLEIRTVQDDELTAYRTCMMTTFGEDLESDPEGDARLRALIPAAQRWAVHDGGMIVATAATFDHAIGVPGGGTLPIAGLTMVTVRPTHRRRGILRQLIDTHLADARARGFASSALWASEAGIYGRFGYGLAAQAINIEIEDSRTITLRERPLDEVAWIDEATARTMLPPVYARAMAGRPGALRRTGTWWHERRFLESPFARGGASRRRHVIARRDGEVVGYVQFRQQGKFAATKPNGKVSIIELVGIDARAELSLWQFVLRVDLFPNIAWELAPIDDVLAWAVTDPRRISRHFTDGLWLRIEDIPATLATRTYSHDGVLRFAANGGTFELTVEAGRGGCVATTKAPSIQFADTGLASTFLGGERAIQLARAERITGDPAAIALADRMFASAIHPWCPEVF